MTLSEFKELPGGVRMIVTQGNLDHWFNADLWGGESNIRPASAAFAMAEHHGLVQHHVTRPDYRLTDLGRSMRRQLESAR